MDANPPIKPEPPGSEDRFVKPEPLDDPMTAPPISRVASEQPSHNVPTTTSSAPLSPDPFSPARQTEAGMSTSPNAPIKADPEIEQDKNLNPSDVESSGTNYLDQLITVTVPETLETGVTIGIDLLDRLKVHLSAFKNIDVDTWLDTINTLKESAKPTRTVVGVVGNTGAGKSSVINALLDEER